MAKIKGQHLRLFIDEEVVAAANSCQLTVNAEVETVSTKDNETDWEEKEVTRLNWSAQTDAMVVISDDEAYVLNDSLNAIKDKETVGVDFALSEGRERGDIIVCGMAKVTDISVNAPNGQHATMSITLTGVSELQISRSLLQTLSDDTEE